MTAITQPITGRVYSVLLAPISAYVVVQVNDRFFETFVPRSEAERLRVGRKVIASPSECGTTIRMLEVEERAPLFVELKMGHGSQVVRHGSAKP